MPAVLLQEESERMAFNKKIFFLKNKLFLADLQDSWINTHEST